MRLAAFALAVPLANAIPSTRREPGPTSGVMLLEDLQKSSLDTMPLEGTNYTTTVPGVEDEALPYYGPVLPSPCVEMEPHTWNRKNLALFDPNSTDDSLTCSDVDGTHPILADIDTSSQLATQIACEVYYFINATSKTHPTLYPCTSVPDEGGQFKCGSAMDKAFTCPRLPVLKCGLTGDPHMLSFSGDMFEHQGTGVYELFSGKVAIRKDHAHKVRAARTVPLHLACLLDVAPIPVPHRRCSSLCKPTNVHPWDLPRG